MKIVKCVKIKSELRVMVEGETGFVKFPKALREEGKRFAVDSLKKNGTHWEVVGEIFELTPVIPKKQLPEKTFVKFQEYNDHEGETWYFIAPKDMPGVSEVISIIQKYKKLDQDEINAYDWEEITQEEANLLIKQKGSCNYFDEFNKVTGIVPPNKVYPKLKNFAEIKTLEDIFEYMYKAKCFEF